MSRKQAGLVAGVAAGVMSVGYSGAKVLAWADRRRHGVSPDLAADAAVDLAEPVGARHRTLASHDGGRIHVVEVGDAGAPPIVLLHGVTLSSVVWNHQLTDLAEHHRVIAVDLRGHGKSSPGREGYGVDQLADDIATVLRDLDLMGAILVGHSMGGMAVMNFCRRHADVLYRRVNGIVFMSTAASDVASGPASSPFRLGRLFAEKSPELAAKAYQGVPGDLGYVMLRLGFGKSPSPLWVEQIRTMLAGTSPTAVARSTLALLDHDERKVLRSLELPVLVMVGTSDLVTPVRQSRLIAELVPGGRLDELDGAGHLLMLERRAEVSGELLMFAAACRPRQPKRPARR